ncbi:putative DENN domain-containing protein 10 B [Uloborus diversus]|uniref:putative DENN domain-containing protein 10 B n=1 Tax=Uloborus diversus TaxID=327109 RepID=UPI00240A413F|nr:putative DENN domain-containing protein 10 B [Uloborus diversus]
MAFVSDLIAAGVIEKDSNNDVLWTWAYPAMLSEDKALLISKCGLGNNDLGHDLGHGHHTVSFCYCHHHQSWFYLHLTELFELPILPKVKQFVLVLQTRDFNPEKYESLSRILSKTYCQTGNPADMLQLYLSVLVKGKCSSEDNGTFLVQQFDEISVYSSVPAKDVVKTFGLETILIYTALLLKKRIVVYHHRLDTLLCFVRALPAFVWHRQNWNIIYPYMQLSSEVSELLTLSTYVAGFRDAAVESRTDLYDVFVNLAAIEITIAAHAKEIFAMTKTHKDIAVFMTRQAENTELSDKMFIKEVSNKTNELLKNLKTLAVKNEFGQEVIRLSDLKEKKVNLALENFLWNLAIAEGYVDV